MRCGKSGEAVFQTERLLSIFDGHRLAIFVLQAKWEEYVLNLVKNNW